MKKMIPVAIALAALLLTSLAAAEVVQRGHLRVSFEGSLAPQTLPRHGSAPIRVAVAAKISSSDDGRPPQLRKIAIAINRYGRIETRGLPACTVDDIQPSTTEKALEACRSSLVGKGSFSAKVLLPEQAPFPSDGKVFAFNGTYNHRPAILAHIYGTNPTPTSITLPFLIGKAKGTFGTVLTASLPRVTSKWGYVTGLQMNLQRRFSVNGRARSYISAGCPAPKALPGAVFPFAKATFSFSTGEHLSQTLERSCRARG